MSSSDKFTRKNKLVYFHFLMRPLELICKFLTFAVNIARHDFICKWNFSWQRFSDDFNTTWCLLEMRSFVSQFLQWNWRIKYDQKLLIVCCHYYGASQINQTVFDVSRLSYNPIRCGVIFRFSQQIHNNSTIAITLLQLEKYSDIVLTFWSIQHMFCRTILNIGFTYCHSILKIYMVGSKNHWRDTN